MHDAAGSIASSLYLQIYFVGSLTLDQIRTHVDEPNIGVGDAPLLTG